MQYTISSNFFLVLFPHRQFIRETLRGHLVRNPFLILVLAFRFNGHRHRKIDPQVTVELFSLIASVLPRQGLAFTCLVWQLYPAPNWRVSSPMSDNSTCFPRQHPNVGCWGHEAEPGRFCIPYHDVDVNRLEDFFPILARYCLHAITVTPYDFLRQEKGLTTTDSNSPSIFQVGSDIRILHSPFHALISD